jgi:mRNA deadenylase 3'-5' endonuclease subunit Ccr4
MSYNILADRLAYHHLFHHTTKEILHFDHRGPRILKEVEEANADIIGFQEMDHVDDYWRENLAKSGYSLIPYARPGFFRSEGIAIAYKKDKFKKLDTDFVDMDDLVGVYPGGRAFKYGNQAMFVLFEGNGKQFVVGCCHLHFNPHNDFVKFA